MLVLRVVDVDQFPIGVDIDIRLAQHRNRFFQPFIVVRGNLFIGPLGGRVMAIAVAGETPAHVLQFVRNRFGLSQRFRVSGVVHQIGGETQRALIASGANHALLAAVGEIRMLFHEFFQNGRDGVVVRISSIARLVVGIGHQLAVLVQGEAVGHAVGPHILIKVQVVDGEHQRLFAGRQHQRFRLLGHAVFVHLIQQVNIDQHIAVFVKLPHHFFEFWHSDEIVVKALGLGVPVEGQLRVGDERMEKDMLHRPLIIFQILKINTGLIQLFRLGPPLRLVLVNLLQSGLGGSIVRLLDGRLRRRQMLLRRLAVAEIQQILVAFCLLVFLCPAQPLQSAIEVAGVIQGLGLLVSQLRVGEQAAQ